jgi:hypothetical protein
MENLKERDRLENLGVDGRIILNLHQLNIMGGCGMDYCGWD